MAQSLSEQLTSEQIDKFISFRDKWQWIGYVAVPILLIIKISVIALLIDIGCVFYNEKLPYKQLFRMALLGESIFLVIPIILLGFSVSQRQQLSFIAIWKIYSISIHYQL